MEEKKVVITGGLGHIGSHLTWVLSSNHKVTIIDNLATQRYHSLRGLSDNVTFLQGEYHKFPEAIEQCDVLIHLAAHNEALASLSNVEEYTTNNITNLAKLLDQVKGNQTVIFPSTTSIYGDYDKPIEEDSDCIRPQSYYAQTKKEGEELVRKATKNHYILRLGTIFGPSPGMRFHTAINKFCLKSHLEQKLTVWKEYLDFTRPYLGLNDLSWVIQEGCIRSQIPTGTYNVVSKNETLRNIIDTIKYLRPKTVVDLIESPLKGQASYIVSTKKLESYGLHLGQDIEYGIAETTDYLNGRHL